METREERLMCLHPRLNAFFNPITAQVEVGKEGWTMLNNSLYYHETTIDLSGYSLQDLTFVPTAVGIQDPGIYYVKLAGGDTPTLIYTQVLDIVTSVPLDPDTVSNLQLAKIGPGLLGSTEDFAPIILGQYRFFIPSNEFTMPALQTLQRSVRFDSGEPTAASKLFCYRILQIYTEGAADPYGVGTNIQVPSARYILQGLMTKEEDLVHMMRLKRSYELNPPTD